MDHLARLHFEAIVQQHINPTSDKTRQAVTEFNQALDSEFDRLFPAYRQAPPEVPNSAFDELARTVAEVTSSLTVILPAAHLARDYHLPVRVWASPDVRTAELQRRLHHVWERAVIDGLDRNARFNFAWKEALHLAQQEHILFTSPD